VWIVLRRPLLLPILALSLLTLAACGESRTQVAKPRQHVAGVVLSPGDTVLVLGNSAMAAVAAALHDALSPSGIDVIDESHGLYYNYGDKTKLWDLREEFKKSVEKIDPTLVLVQTFMETPDVQCEMSPERRKECIEAGFQFGYRNLLRDMIKVLSKNGAKVLWLEYSATGWDYVDNVEFRRQQAETLEWHNTAVASLLSEEPSLHISSSSRRADDKDGLYRLYATVDGGYRQTRSPDGLHYCQYGVELIVEQLATELYPKWREKDTIWPGGKWRSFESFSQVQVPWMLPACQDGVLESPPEFK
jgi:hypothetical protein